MKTVIIDNKIRIVENSSRIVLSITVPRLNLQKMKEALNCEIIEKKLIKLNFKHNAGEVFSVKISVLFSKIEKYLREGNIFNCENKDQYLSLFSESDRNNYSTRIMLIDIVALYAFGQFFLNNSLNNNTIYYNKKGNKISLNNQFNKYIRFKNEFYYKKLA